MFTEFKLNNGIRVILEKIPKGRTSLSIGLLVIAGSRYETPSLNGISHFIEHIHFSGTTTRNKKQLNIDIDNVGETNAFTAKDCTFYFINTVKSKLNPVIEVFADIFCNLKFTDADVIREQNVIREEIGSSIDRPFEGMFDKAWENNFGKEGIGLPILGTTDKIKKFNVETLDVYISQFYVTNNIIISVSGDIDENELQSKLEKAFADFRKPKNKKIEIVPQTISFNVKKHKKKINDVYVCFSLAGTNYSHADFRTVRVINEILGSGFSSKLYQKIREELGLAYSIYSFVNCFQDFGLIDIVAATTPESYKKLIVEVKKELKGLNDTITDKNIGDAKAKLILVSEINNDNTEENVFSNAVKCAFIKNPVFDLDSYVKKINAIQPKNVRECIEKYITDKQYSLTIFGNI